MGKRECKYIAKNSFIVYASESFLSTKAEENSLTGFSCDGDRENPDSGVTNIL